MFFTFDVLFLVGLVLCTKYVHMFLIVSFKIRLKKENLTQYSLKLFCSQIQSKLVFLFFNFTMKKQMLLLIVRREGFHLDDLSGMNLLKHF